MGFEEIATFPGWRPIPECDVQKIKGRGASARVLYGDETQLGLYLDIFNDHGNRYDPKNHIVNYRMSKYRPTHKVYWSHLGKQLWLVMPSDDGELRRTRCVVVDVDDETSTLKTGIAQTERVEGRRRLHVCNYVMAHSWACHE